MPPLKQSHPRSPGPSTLDGDDDVTAAPPEKLVGALSSGLAILRYLSASATPVGVTRVARDLHLNASTCFNLLKTLVHERLVTFDAATKTYTLSLGLVELARGALEQASYTRMLRPTLEDIALRFRVTATLWHRTTGERVVLVDRADNPAAARVHMSIGQRLPMYVAALGRCMAAHSGLSNAALLERVRGLRWEDAPSEAQYLEEVARARRQGYAVDRDHYVKGMTTISSAVLNDSLQAIMAISAVGFSAQFRAADLRMLGEALRDKTAVATRALGGRIPAAS